MFWCVGYSVGGRGAAQRTGAQQFLTPSVVVKNCRRDAQSSRRKADLPARAVLSSPLLPLSCHEVGVGFRGEQAMSGSATPDVNGLIIALQVLYMNHNGKPAGPESIVPVPIRSFSPDPGHRWKAFLRGVPDIQSPGPCVQWQAADLRSLLAAGSLEPSSRRVSGAIGLHGSKLRARVRIDHQAPPLGAPPRGRPRPTEAPRRCPAPGAAGQLVSAGRGARRPQGSRGAAGLGSAECGWTHSRGRPDTLARERRGGSWGGTGRAWAGRRSGRR
jgi:hypothetical protein